MTNASFNYPPKLYTVIEKEISQIKGVLKEKVIDDYKVIVYEDNNGGYYLGYIKDNILYCLDSSNSERKQFFNSISFSQFENVLGAEKGFVIGFDMGKYVQYTYYEIYNGVPRVDLLL